MLRTSLTLSLVLAACSSGGSSSTKTESKAVSAAGHRDVESALKAFNAALETGDRTAIRAQFPPRASYANHVDAPCAEGWEKMFDEWANELVQNADIQAAKAIAAKGEHSQLVKVDAADTRSVQAGADGEGCKFSKPLAFVKTSSTWKLEGENHQLGVTVVQLDGRYFVFDLPGK